MINNRNGRFDARYDAVPVRANPPTRWLPSRLYDTILALAMTEAPELAEWMRDGRMRKRQIMQTIQASLEAAGQRKYSTKDIRAPSDDRLVILRCGLGRDSVAMLCALVETGLISNNSGETIHAAEVDAVVFTDVGAEWATTYTAIDAVQRICDDNGLRFLVQAKPPREQQQAFVQAVQRAGTMRGVPRPWHANPPDTIEDRCATGFYHQRPSIMADYASRNAVVAYADAGCTGNHKIAPSRAMINDMSLERWGIDNTTWSALVKKGLRRPHVVLLGIAADEAQRAVVGGGPHYEESDYPLVAMGITKAKETPILKRWGLDWVHKSGCTMCKYAPIAWYAALAVREPARFAEVQAYEANALDGGRKGNQQFIFYKQKQRVGPLVEQWWRENPGDTDQIIAAIMRKDYKRNDTVLGVALPKAQREALADTDDGGLDGR